MNEKEYTEKLQALVKAHRDTPSHDDDQVIIYDALAELLDAVDRGDVEPWSSEPRKPAPMTEAEYVGHSGVLCPVCRSQEVHAEDIESDGDGAWANCDCRSCGASWTDRYRLVGFDNLETPIKEKTNGR